MKVEADGDEKEKHGGADEIFRALKEGKAKLIEEVSVGGQRGCGWIEDGGTRWRRSFEAQGSVNERGWEAEVVGGLW